MRNWQGQAHKSDWRDLLPYPEKNDRNLYLNSVPPKSARTNFHTERLQYLLYIFFLCKKKIPHTLTQGPASSPTSDRFVFTLTSTNCDFLCMCASYITIKTIICDFELKRSASGTTWQNRLNAFAELLWNHPQIQQSPRRDIKVNS